MNPPFYLKYDIKKFLVKSRLSFFIQIRNFFDAIWTNLEGALTTLKSTLLLFHFSGEFHPAHGRSLNYIYSVYNSTT